MFRRQGTQCVASFAQDEVRVLRKVASEVVGLLTDGFDHDDPVVDRLFPAIYRISPRRARRSGDTPRETSRPRRSTRPARSSPG